MHPTGGDQRISQPSTVGLLKLRHAPYAQETPLMFFKTGLNCQDQLALWIQVPPKKIL